MIVYGHSESKIQECLTQKEINDCLERAFEALPEEDQKNIKQVQKRLGQIRGMGDLSVLQLLFAVDQARALARLNEIL